MNYAQYLEKGKTIESTESLIEKVINSQGQDENALQELVNRAQSQDSKAIEFLQMLQQQSGVSKFEKPSGPIVKKDQQDPNMPVAAETGTVDGRKYTYMPYQGEGQAPIDRFEYIGQDGNTYGMTIQGPDTTYVMNGQQYNDPEGQRVIKERRAAVVREKCGGSVKKKEAGDKITRKKVMAKGGCPCMIKKVGGRLIEVDSCTGLPVHRNGGMVRKYQHSAGGGITFKDGTMYNVKGDRLPDTLNAHSQKALGILNINNNPYYFNNGKLYTQESKIGPAVNSYGWAEADLDNMDLSVLNSLNLRKFNFGSKEKPEWQYYQTNKDGSLSKYGDTNSTRYYFAKGNDGKSRMYSDFGASDATWDSKNLTWSREGFNYTPGKGWSAIEPEQPAEENPQKNPVKTWRDTFGAGKAGKFGGKTYDEALALQNEMLNADWFDVNLGTSGINKNGADGMWGANSQKEYTRYLAEKQRREEQAAAATAAEAEKQELNNLQASSIRRTTSDGMTNEALLAMDAGKAMSTLSRPDYERWMKLNQHQQGRNASLVYNGKRYNDETAYNAAVDAETARTAPKLDMQSLLNIRGRRKRNGAYAQYKASMDKHVANNPLYSGPKALTQEQLSATSFKNGGQLNYASYLN